MGNVALATLQICMLDFRANIQQITKKMLYMIDNFKQVMNVSTANQQGQHITESLGLYCRDK